MVDLTPGPRPAIIARCSNETGIEDREGWLVAGVAALAVLAVAELGARWLEPQLLTQGAEAAQEVDRKRALLEEIDGPDVLIVGASDLDAGVRETAFLSASSTRDSVFNASLLGLTPDSMQEWLPDVVDLAGEPDLLVVGISLLTPAADDLDGLRTARDTELTANIRAARRPLGERARELADPIALVRHRPALRQPEVVVDAAGRRLTGSEEPAQLALRDLDWSEAVDRDGSVTFYRGGRYDPERELEDLERTVEEVRSPGGLYTESLPLLFEQLGALDIPTVIVIPPLPTEDLEAVGLEAAELEGLAEDISAEAAAFGLPVVDFSRIGYPREFFADRVHLNNTGSRQFSADLARTLDGF